MSTFDLSLPSDIEWNRLCSTTLDLVPCGSGKVPWESSIVVYKHDVDPGEAEPEKRITYIKVVVSIVPAVIDLQTLFQNLLKLDLSSDAAPSLLTFPTYGALLQVAVNPKEVDIPLYDPIEYPHFSQIEPKKRELLELKSETGELLTGSGESIEVGKSKTNLRQTERSSGLSISSPVGGVNLGSSRRSASQSTESMNTEASTERRETMSHTTQMAQMYNMLQSWHQGTNRALFLMEPRPHIMGSRSYFLGGLRKLEGIQEFFLVIERPGTMLDFCLNVLLETSHAKEVEVVEYTTSTQPFEVKFKYPTPSGPVSGKRTHAGVIELTDGTIFDEANGEFLDIEMPIRTEGVRSFNAKVTSPTTLAYEAEVDWDLYRPSNGGLFRYNPLHADFHGILTARVKTKKVTQKKTLSYFLLAKELCCCSIEEIQPDIKSSVTLETSAPAGLPPIKVGPTTPETINDERIVAEYIRNETIASLSNPNRVAVGEVPLDKSNVVLSLAAERLNELNPTGEMVKLAQTSSLIEPGLRSKLSVAMPNKSVSHILNASSTELSRALQTPLANVLQMKAQIVDAMAPKPIVFATRPVGIIGVRFGTNYTPAGIFAEISSVASPAQVQYLRLQDYINRIQVEFGNIPDTGTVTTTSLKVMFNGAALPATVSQVTTSIWQIELINPIAASGQYQLMAVGTGGSPITFGSQALDGEAFGFPTGNGVAGSDFVMNMAMPTVAPLPPVVPPVLIVVSGVRIRTTIPTTTTLFTMINPLSVVQLAASQNPNRVVVNFNVTPDGGTVSGTTFLVTTATGAVAGTVTISGSEATFAPTAAFALDTLHTVTLKGTTPSITYSTRKLDGEPYAIPSGNQTEGSDFYFQFIINSTL